MTQLSSDLRVARAKPILFSRPMVRALLDGRKTQTRRVMKPQPELQPNGFYHVHNRGGGVVNVREEDVSREALDYVPYAVGDRLYVREAWRAWWGVDDQKPSLIVPPVGLWYEADDKPEGGVVGAGKFRQGMHMPRWASRLTLTVTDVRVQRLQEISEGDARSEGAFYGPPPHDVRDAMWSYGVGWHPTAFSAYSELWDTLNAERDEGRYAWARDPWVVAVTFTVDKRNIDAISTEEARAAGEAGQHD